MNASTSLTIALTLSLVGWFTACRLVTAPSGEERVDFASQIKPMFEVSCLECHNHVDAPRMGGLNLETRRTALSTGVHAPVIIAGAPERSVLVRVLKLGHAHPAAMPPTPDKLWLEKQHLVEQWIREGAQWPEDIRLVRPQDWNTAP